MDKRTVPGTMPTLIADLTCAANGSYTENYIRALCERAAEAIKDLESVRSGALPNVEEIPEYFAKPGITEGLANAHPTLLVRQMANEILRLRALSPARVAEEKDVDDNELLNQPRKPK